MTIGDTAHLTRLARKKGLIEAAELIEREADRLLRKAAKYDIGSEDWDCNRYEDLESEASFLGAMAGRIRRRAKRPHGIPERGQK